MTGAELQALLDRAGLSQVGAAKKLKINDRSMRRYVATEGAIPRTVEFAARWLNHTRSKDYAPTDLVDALAAIATVLEAPRDRLGRLDLAWGNSESTKACEAAQHLQNLSIVYGATGNADTLEMCAKVARAIIARTEIANSTNKINAISAKRKPRQS